MDKIWRVAWTEYLNSVRSKAFIIGVLALPLLAGLSIGLQYYADKKKDISDRRFAVVDHSGALYGTIATKAKERNETWIFQPAQNGKREQNAPRFIAEEFRSEGRDARAVEAALSERVRRKELDAFIIIGKEAASAEAGAATGIAYYAQSHTYTELADWLEHTLNDEIHKLRLERAGLDQKLVSKLTGHVPVKRLGLASVDTATGEVKKAKEENRAATFAVPFGCMFLLYMMVMSAAPALLNTVLEEKMAKISEVLLSSVSPFQLMLGKLLGATMVSLTLTALYLSTIGWLLWKFSLSHLVTPEIVAWFLLFELLQLLIFGSFFSAVGAACSEIRDAQNFMFPVMMMVMLPFFVWMPVMQSPNSSFARLVSLFPPATPMLMMLRIAIPPGPPWWEVALGVVLTTLFMLASVWAAGKIFRIGLLAQGQAPTFAKLFKWVLSK